MKLKAELGFRRESETGSHATGSGSGRDRKRGVRGGIPAMGHLGRKGSGKGGWGG